MFIEATDDGGGGDNWSCTCKWCKAPVKPSPPTNHHPVFLQAGCPSCHPTNSVKALKGIQLQHYHPHINTHTGYPPCCLVMNDFSYYMTITKEGHKTE